MKNQICPRCQTSFLCQADTIQNCQCSQIKLDSKTIDFLAKTEYSCLCINCLSELQKLVQFAQQTSPPRRSSEFVEGLHYESENGVWVFTELYHLLRGSCCQNGCRNCAYGFVKQ